MLRVTRTCDLQHGSSRFDDELIRMDANYLALGERYDELFPWIELHPMGEVGALTTMQSSRNPPWSSSSAQNRRVL